MERVPAQVTEEEWKKGDDQLIRDLLYAVSKATNSCNHEHFVDLIYRLQQENASHHL